MTIRERRVRTNKSAKGTTELIRSFVPSNDISGEVSKPGFTMPDDPFPPEDPSPMPDDPFPPPSQRSKKD